MVLVDRRSVTYKDTCGSFAFTAPFSSNVVRMIEFQQDHARRERGINWLDVLVTIFPSEREERNEHPPSHPNVARHRSYSTGTHREFLALQVLLRCLHPGCAARRPHGTRRSCGRTFHAFLSPSRVPTCLRPTRQRVRASRGVAARLATRKGSCRRTSYCNKKNNQNEGAVVLHPSPATFDSEPCQLSSASHKVVVVQEAHNVLGRRIGSAYIWWGVPYRCRHRL